MDESDYSHEPFLFPVMPPWPPWIAAPELLAAATHKPLPLIDNLFDAGSRMLVGGGSKTFKTWLLCDLAVSLSAGMPWLGFICRRAGVLYVNFELRDFYLQSRFRQILAAKRIDAPERLKIWNLRGFEFSLSPFIDLLSKSLPASDIRLVIIDPFYKLLTPLEDENNQTQMAAVLARFAAINALDVSVLFAMHFSKGNQATKDPLDRISGAGTLARDPDNVITLTPHQSEHSFVLDFIIRDHPPIDSFTVSWKTPLLVRSDHLDPLQLKGRGGRPSQFSSSSLLGLLQDNDDAWNSAAFREAATGAFGCSEATFYRMRDSLVHSKAIFQSKATGNWCVLPSTEF
jgi:hypothetical protein